MGLTTDFTRRISNLYSGASTEFVTSNGLTSPVGIRHGTLPGDSLSPLLFDRMVEPLIRWLTPADKGYNSPHVASNSPANGTRRQNTRHQLC